MAASIAEYLRQDMECEGLLECVYGLTPLDRTVFKVVVHAAEPLAIEEIATAIDRERSTAYRSVQRLHSTGFIAREQVNYEHGGYHYVYRAVDPARVAAEIQRLLDDWHDQMERLVGEFQAKYGE